MQSPAAHPLTAMATVAKITQSSKPSQERATKAQLTPPEFKTKLAEAAPLASSLKQVGETTFALTDRVAKAASAGKIRAKEIATDPRTQVTAASAAGGAVVLGAGGATAGMLAGGALGAAVGVVPALFTFGLSIPIGMMIGGGCGLVGGGALGGTTGFVGGGAAGFGAYTKRAAIRNAATSCIASIKKARRTVKEVVVYVYAKNRHRCIVAAQKIGARAAVARSKVVATAEKARLKTMDVASQRVLQVTAASAAGGAAVVGAGGAATGALTGGVLGAAVGLVPALFTFGLSIPFCAVVGGGCGLVGGSAIGGTTGFVAGGAGGYGIYTKRMAISNKVEVARTYAKETASSSAEFFRTKWTGATGGTPE